MGWFCKFLWGTSSFFSVSPASGEGTTSLCNKLRSQTHPLQGLSCSHPLPHHGQNHRITLNSAGSIQTPRCNLYRYRVPTFVLPQDYFRSIKTLEIDLIGLGVARALECSKPQAIMCAGRTGYMDLPTHQRDLEAFPGRTYLPTLQLALFI